MSTQEFNAVLFFLLSVIYTVNILVIYGINEILH